MSFIQTYTGKKFYPFDPNPDDIDIVDIAHALSLVTRFTGHTTEFYSVAQHSVLVSQQVSSENALQALLHDASEAYLTDLSSPVKHHPSMALYREAEKRLQACIYAKFGIPLEMAPEVHEADQRMLATEARDLMNDPEWALRPYVFHITPWVPWKAERVFMSAFKALVERAA